MIGIFDSGYGGLTILNEIRKVLPEYDYLYLGDNARAPYGTRSFDVIYEYTLQAVNYLYQQGCNLIILACKRVAVFANTGTSLIKLALTENQIKISAQDIDFSTSAEETIACDYTGMPMAIGFKAPFLIEILSSIASQDVVLALADPARAGLILPSENEENQDLLVLLMPMLLND